MGHNYDDDKVKPAPPALLTSDSPANARQVGGSHYASDLQHWDVCVKHGVQYLEAAATKYVTRWRKKAGLQDLEKAGHYLQKAIETAMEARRMRLIDSGFGIVPPQDVFDFCIINELPRLEANFCRLLFTWRDIAHLRDAMAILETLVQTEKERLAKVKAEEDARPRAVDQPNPFGFKPEGE